MTSTPTFGFDDFHSDTEFLANAGLAQGSPLSLILFAFLNTDLVDQPIDSRGGASAFIVTTNRNGTTDT